MPEQIAPLARRLGITIDELFHKYLTIDAVLIEEQKQMKAVYVLAPDVILVLLGSGFEPVVKITRILALTIPLFGVGHVVAVQGLVALNEGFYYAVVTTFGGVLNVVLAFILVPRFGIEGMAAGLVISVFAITIGFCVMYFVRSAHRRR